MSLTGQFSLAASHQRHQSVAFSEDRQRISLLWTAERISRGSFVVDASVLGVFAAWRETDGSHAETRRRKEFRLLDLDYAADCWRPRKALLLRGLFRKVAHRVEFAEVNRESYHQFLRVSGGEIVTCVAPTPDHLLPSANRGPTRSIGRGSATNHRLA